MVPQLGSPHGELEMRLPTGYVYDAAGKVVLDPDVQVREAIAKFFDTFTRTGSATAVVRTFGDQDLLFPRRLSTGARKGEVAWGKLLHSRALRILKNPRYTGAFVYGRTKSAKLPGGGELRRPLPRDKWNTVILGAHPGYISWEEYEANLARLHENAQANGSDRRKSPPREGNALLQGLVLCGRCGERMTVRYHVRRGEQVPEYLCQKRGIEYAEPICQRLVGDGIDRAVGELIVATMTPLALQAALAVHDELATRTAEADGLRLMQVERARYEADLAQRRFLRVDPDNRLVAQSLEADWNEKLRALNDAAEDYERRKEADGRGVGESQREEVLSLATDFPRLWADPGVPMRERKRMLRLLVEDVTLMRTDKVAVHVRFRGGATHSLYLPLPLGAAELRKVDPAVVAEVDRLLDDHTDAEIAEMLNARGFRPGVAEHFTSYILYRLRRTYKLEDRYSRLRRRGLLSLDEIAELLGAHTSTVKGWARIGHISSQVYNDKGQRLYERPDSLQQHCQFCGSAIPAKPSFRKGKKWCSQRCCQAAYHDRKRLAATTSHNDPVSS